MNQREIKFRAWDKEGKKMLEMSVSTNYQPHFLQDLKSFGGGFRELFDPDLELMQFTGLKDKNGKEIYEGDIVKDFDWEERLCEVAFNGWSWRLKNIQSGWWKDWSSDLEVIGNIYENPELLEEVRL